MKNSLIIITFLAFIIYWLITLFFNFPDNPINIDNLKSRQNFDTHLFQRWGFFAPPPTSNHRLYLSYFYNDDDNPKIIKTRTFEVLQLITAEKRKRAPFNRKQDVLDYIISGSVHNIQTNIKQVSDVIRIQEKKNKKALTQQQKSKQIIETIEKTESFKNLSNYAKIVAKKNKIPFNNTLFKITITHIEIPKFVNKNSSNKREEQIILSSNTHTLKPLK